MCAVQHGLPSQWLIAIVDDDDSVRQAVANLLKSVGYTPLGFESAEQFLAFPQRDTVDCLVLDIKLKQMDGFQLQQHLLALGCRMPIVFISGHADAAMQQRALAAGAVALLRKPIDVEALLGHIDVTLAARGPRL